MARGRSRFVGGSVQETIGGRHKDDDERGSGYRLAVPEAEPALHPGVLDRSGPEPVCRGRVLPDAQADEVDREAASWGLFAWEDPLTEDGPPSPFGVDLPTLEGESGR